jgi:signal transduction histidine kinase
VTPDSNPKRRTHSRVESVDSEIKALLLQLQVYQGELESQNEELQRAQQELATSLHRYTELYEQAPVGYVTLDSHGRIAQANRAARALLELPAPGDPPALFTRYVARHSVAVLRSHIQRAWREGAAPALEIHMSPVDADLRLSIRLTFSMDQSAQSLRVVLTDVTGLRVLEHAAQHAALVEHERMSADIHDGLSQDLTGLSLSLRGLQARTAQGVPPGVTDLEGLNAITMAALASCRDIVRGLSPVGENEGGLVPALRGMVERAGAAANPAVRFELTGHALVRVALGTADHLYRIAQEGLTNARRHSSAREIVLSIDVQRESITLTIADDGCGHDTQRTDAGGMGLRLMQFRASSIGARLTSESVLGSGTRVRCVCPQPLERP